MCTHNAYFPQWLFGELEIYFPYFLTLSSNHSTRKTRIFPFYIANTMATDDLATQGVRSAATVVLTFSSVSAPEWLKFEMFVFQCVCKFVFTDTQLCHWHTGQFYVHLYDKNVMTSSNCNIFRVTGPLCGEFTGHRWIPPTKASDAELWCFLWSVLVQTVD